MKKPETKSQACKRIWKFWTCQISDTNVSSLHFSVNLLKKTVKPWGLTVLHTNTLGPKDGENVYL